MIPTGDEIAVLDGSVDELSRQTKELLSGYGGAKQSKKEEQPTSHAVSKEKSEEPKIEKEKHKSTKSPAQKLTVSHHNGRARSFDIIHSPAKRKLQASLRARPQEPAPEPPSLQDRTADNEQSISEPPEEKAESAPSTPTSPAIVHHHAKGTLGLVAQPEEEQSQAEVAEEPDTTSEDPAFIAPKKQIQGPAITAPEATSPATQALSFSKDSTEQTEESSEPADTSKNDTEDTKEQAHEPEESTGQDQEPEAQTANQKVATTASRSYEPKSFTPVKDEDAPFFFDANEHQPVLNDWSKLEKRHRGSWYVLALLLIIAGVLVFLVFSGRTLPFLPS